MPDRGIYVVHIENGALTNANGDYDICELAAVDDEPIEIVSWHLYNTTEIGDAQEEQLRMCWVRGNATTGNGGAITPTPCHPKDEAASFTAEGPSSTPASTGTAVNVHPFTWNVRVPFDYWCPPGERFGTDQGAGFLCLRLLAAVTDDMNISASIYVKQV